MFRAYSWIDRTVRAPSSPAPPGRSAIGTGVVTGQRLVDDRAQDDRLREAYRCEHRGPRHARLGGDVLDGCPR